MTITRGQFPPNSVGKTLSVTTGIEPTDSIISMWFDELGRRYRPTGEVWVRRDGKKAWQVWFALEVR